MSTTLRVRKASLALHVASSVGWFGAVLVYVALGVAAVSSDDTALTAAVYVTMDWAAWVVLVPLAVASLVSGVVQSLVSPWGLMRHYWVVVKLVLTAVATGVLLAYTQTLSTLADVAARTPLTAGDLAVLRSSSVIVHTTGALVVLVLALLLAVYKPRGLTRHGQRRQRAASSVSAARFSRS